MTEVKEVKEDQPVDVQVADELHEAQVDEIAHEMLNGTAPLPIGRPFKLNFEAGIAPALAEGIELTAGTRKLEVTHVRTRLGSDITEVFCKTV